MQRRAFLRLTGAAAVWPVVAHAQPATKIPTIGFLGAATPSAWRHYVPPFVQRLSELGWVDGRTVAIEYRWGEGRAERFAEIAAEFVRLKVDVIVTSGTAAGAAKLATSSIPIIFAVAVDPIGANFVNSLARPGGNLTGLSSQTGDLGGKRLSILREVVPTARRLAILGNATYRAVQLEMDEVAAAGRALGFEPKALGVRAADEIVPSILAVSNYAEALYVCTESFAAANRNRIVIASLGARLPTVYGERSHVEAGGLLSYGANVPDLFRRSAHFVDKVLRGANPANLPVEQATKFDLIINVITAKALGINVPSAVLARADEVIE